MGKATTKAAASGPTGRYVFCPASNSGHGLYAVAVHRSPKDNLWSRCVCGTRVYFPRGLLARMTKTQALQTPGCQIIGE